jgi:hypothetical protein
MDAEKPQAFKPYLSWGVNEYTQVSTLQELTQTIDRLITIAKADRPFTVELYVNAETGMGMVVGLEESSLQFYSTLGGPLVVGCSGPWDDDSLIAFYHGGHRSELPRRYCVPIMDAIEAMKHYFQTGMRPENIKWGIT